MLRKTIILRRILTYFARPGEIKKYDEIYQTSKGSATHYGLRLIEEYFDRKAKPYKYEKSDENREKTVLIQRWDEKN